MAKKFESQNRGLLDDSNWIHKVKHLLIIINIYYILSIFIFYIFKAKEVHERNSANDSISNEIPEFDNSAAETENSLIADTTRLCYYGLWSHRP